MLFTSRHAFVNLLTAGLVAAAGWASTVSVHARQEAATTDTAQIRLAELPAQGRATYQKILSGGPFAYDKDGTVFGNRERLLPQKRRGYYREYTVTTPGARNRGARRIVCGGLQPSVPDSCFYTSDHYASFRRIVE